MGHACSTHGKYEKYIHIFNFVACSEIVLGYRDIFFYLQFESALRIYIL
jgi:hypothetical protein